LGCWSRSVDEAPEHKAFGGIQIIATQNIADVTAANANPSAPTVVWNNHNPNSDKPTAENANSTDAVGRHDRIGVLVPSPPIAHAPSPHETIKVVVFQ
jgi:hypothetical protein